MPDNPRIEDLRRRVQQDPASIAFAQLAEEYRRAGLQQEAIDTCRAGLARHPGYLSARVTLGRALLARTDVFTGVFAERLLTYATGRAMRSQDMPAVRAVTRAAAQNGYRFSSFVVAAVTSAPFQAKTKSLDEQQPEH